MIPLDYDPAYSAGVRNLLIETATPRKSKRGHRIWVGISLVAGLSVLGAGGAVAANSLLPGADIITDTGSSHTVTGVGPTDISIGAAPDGTNSLETSLTCLSAGTLTWPDGASQTCTSEDAAHPGKYSLAWTTDATTFHVGATASTRWRLTYTFSNRQPTSLATNAAGQTYGIDSNNEHPDLIAATATNGRDGYVVAKQLAAAANACSNAKTSAENVQCTEDQARKTVTVPVYESDGKTQIGVFQIGG